MKNSKIKIVALSSNIEMANEIASYLNLDVTDTKVYHFADGEILFESYESFRGSNVYIIQSTCCPATENLMEILLCIDACKRADAKSVNCLIPYFGYARQDRMAKPRQPISARLVADLLTTAGADKIITTDLHVPQIQGFFKIPVDEISPVSLFAEYFKKLNLKNAVCVSPDHGGALRTSRLAKLIDLPLAIVDKRRPRPNESYVYGIVGDIVGKTCIIVDDIVDTAGTLCNTAEKLIELGAKEVYAAITHGVLSNNAIEKIDASVIKKLVITNTIPLSKKSEKDKIEILNMSHLYADIIKTSENHESIEPILNN